ncbi:hypothetical protein BB561_005923 [Smittium simulii]|uniref:GH16 domain-containing protein n=1 Tax=Smittium simulii TaxID=133385 RepID=A0A2T9Y7I3_9FUNG|nr:hypothetical protein BB561_005923 [Smittium simulii]
MLQLSMNKECGTNLISNRNFTYGRVDIVMKTASGSGAVTALVLMGPSPSDEIDIEFVGKDPTNFQSMYFVKGLRIDQQAGFHSSSPSSDLSASFHTYSFELTATAVNWYIDNSLVRSLKKSSDSTFPTAAGNFRMGVWDGSNTSGWAGTVDWSSSPKVAYIKSIKYNPYC